MASTTAAGARLRKTFKYPSDSETSDEEARDELDEEEQEQIVSQLHSQNAQQNARYTLAFSLLPCSFTLAFIFIFSTAPLLSILGITSLLISTGRARFSCRSSSLPPPPSLRPTRRPTPTRIQAWTQLTALEDRVLDIAPEGGPLRIALPWLNAAICVMLALTAAILYRKSADGGGRRETEGMWIVFLLPGIATMMVEGAVRSMRDVEKGVEELDRLKYRYKGA